jgi:hypothetical protein
MKRMVVALIVAAVVSWPGVTSTAAQTPAAARAQCVPPQIVESPGFPETVASPMASPIASPAASPSPVAALPVDLDTVATIERIAQQLAACLTDGNADGVADLTTADFRGEAFGGGLRMSRADYLILSETAPVIPTRIVSIQNVSFSGLRTVAADIGLVAGNQLRLERWTFVFRSDTVSDPSTPIAAGEPREGYWLAHHLEPLAPIRPSGAGVVQVELTEYDITLSDTTVSPGNLVLEGQNTGVEAHEMLVLRLDEGTTPDVLLRPMVEGFPASVEVIGQVTLPPGEAGDLVLVDLPSGQYTIVCLLPDGNGVPHLVFDQVAEFTVR